jgi:hypothetical protein
MVVGVNFANSSSNKVHKRVEKKRFGNGSATVFAF